MLRENLYYQKQGFAALKGFNTKTQIDKRTDLLDVDYAKRLPLSPKTEEALKDFLGYCQANNLRVIFTRFPHKIMREEMVERAYRGNQAEEIIKEYGFDFIHLERDYQDAQIDPDTDYYNDDHLNIYGAQKLTHYWGELLTTKYGVTPHELSKTQQKEWDYTVDYTNRFLDIAEQRINNGTNGSFYETAAMKDILYD